MTNIEITLFVLWCWLLVSEKNEQHKLRMKKWHAAHKAQQADYRHEYRHGSNREKWLASSHESDEARRSTGSKSQYHTKYLRGHRKKNPAYALAEAIRNRIKIALKKNYKASKTVELLGCSLAALRTHLEKLFLPGMTWENHGEWHIDHVKPCAKFDLSDPAQQRECFHYTNLQPLWAIDNLRKGAR